MKLHGERKRATNLRSLDVTRPAEEMRPHIDLQRIVDRVFSISPNLDKKAVLEHLGTILPGLVGPTFLPQFAPEKQQTQIKKGSGSLREEWVEIIRLTKEKLWRPSSFSSIKWNKRKYQPYIPEFITLGMEDAEDEYAWKFYHGLILTILLPQERSRIARELAPTASQYKDYVIHRRIAQRDYDVATAFSELRLLGLDSGTEAYVREVWPEWQRSLERSFTFLETHPDNAYETHVILTLAIGMHILSAESIDVTDEGVKIIPSQVKNSGHELPERPLA